MQAGPALLSAAAMLFGAAPAIAQETAGGARGPAPQAQESPSIEDKVRALTRDQMRRCWRPPVGAAAPERLRVTVRFKLKPDGALDGEPEVVTPPHGQELDAEMQRVADGAVAAVRACAPYSFASDPEIGAHYDLWRDMELSFVPR